MPSFNSFKATIATYRAKHIDPSTCPSAWDNLWNDIATAYRKGQLSDNEHDTLLSMFHN